MCNDYNTNNERCQAFSDILSDIKSHKDFQRALSPALSEAYRNTRHWSEVKDTRLRACGDFVMLAPSGKIIGANFCKNRFCPFCQWRLSRRVFGQTQRIVNYIQEHYQGFEFLFLTVTISNSVCLSEGLNCVLKGFNNLTHDRTWRRVVRGFMRSLEITYNDEAKTWHPHVHAILAVSDKYFQNEYITQKGWRKLWDRAARIDYESFVNVKKVYGDLVAAVSEISKYSVKPSSLNVNEVDEVSVYSDLIDSTFKRRLRSFGGVFREAIKNLGVDLDNDYLDDYDQEKEGCTYLLYDKRTSNYYETKDGSDMEVFFKNEKV